LKDPDYYVGIASTMDKHGFFTCSLSATYEKDMVERAKCVVLEVNENAPRTHGDTQIHISQVDFLYEADNKIPELPNALPNELDKKIASNITEIVEDGSTIQIGIGGIPNAVAGLLKNKKNLGIHTEMFTESMIDLFELGVITNSKKTLWPGKAICTFALGSQKMYDFMDRLINIVLPRVRDFQGTSLKSFDQNGNYNLGLKDCSVFPELNIEDIAKIHGLQITITTTSKNPEHVKTLLTEMGFPFKKITN
jgi:acyl-CoA hydrolase